MMTMTETTMMKPGQAMAEGRETMMMQMVALKQAKETGRGQVKGWLSRCVLGGLLALTLLPVARADTITIGKGTGIVYEGLPFNVSMSGQVYGDGTIYPSYGMLSITIGSLFTGRCLLDSAFTSIGGYKTIQIVPGIGAVPRATATARYRLSDGYGGGFETLSGTIGLPETKGQVTTAGVGTLTAPAGFDWCLSPRMVNTANFLNATYPRTITFSGTWVLVADGSQQSGEVAFPALYARSLTLAGQGSLQAFISPTNLTLRVSNLACTVATTKQIDFGNVERNTTADSELASRTYPLVVSCSQDTDRINANINVQFRPLSGLYGGSRYRLALAEGNGYITGEIDNGVTSSGACNLNTGIPFDNTQLKVGNILATDTSKTFSNQVTWRLCSGGANLPTGPVTASAEMLVTFN